MQHRRIKTEDDLIKAIVDVAKKLQFKLEPFEIIAIHRLPTKKKISTRPIIVRLTNLRKKSKEVRLDAIYINDHLTTTSREILDKARELRDERYFKYAWFVANGKVLIKADNIGRTIAIRSMMELKELREMMDREESDTEVQAEGKTRSKRDFASHEEQE